jgi:hypothetical protein
VDQRSGDRIEARGLPRLAWEETEVVVEENPGVAVRPGAVRDLHAADDDVPVRGGDDLDPELQAQVLGDEGEIRDGRVASLAQLRLEAILDPVDGPVDRDRDPGGTAERLMVRGNVRSVELTQRPEAIARDEQRTISDENGARQREPPDLPTEPSRANVRTLPDTRGDGQHAPARSARFQRAEIDVDTRCRGFNHGGTCSHRPARGTRSREISFSVSTS